MHKAIWRDYNQFPQGNGQWEMIRPPWGRLFSGREKVLKAVKKWNSWDPLLLTTPESQFFLPPICVNSISDNVRRNLISSQLAFTILLGVLAVGFGISYILTSFDERFLRAAVLVFSGLLYVGTDTYLIQRSKECLIERAMFVHWVFSRKNILVILFAVTMLLTGLGQFFLEKELGGFDNVVMAYGVYFKSVESGQWWRYLTGPFIHSGLLHWVNNLFMGIIAIGLAGTFGKKSLILYFITWMVASSICVKYFSSADALVGISGGVFGLFGWAIAYAFKKEHCFQNILVVTRFVFFIEYYNSLPIFNEH